MLYPYFSLFPKLKFLLGKAFTTKTGARILRPGFCGVLLMVDGNKPLFFFGSLMDYQVLAIVLGRSIDRGQLKPGTLNGYRCEREAKESYPILVPYPDGVAEILVARDLTPEDINRILFYETGEYDLVPFSITLDGVETKALGFATGEDIHSSGSTWHLKVWQSKDKSTFLPMAQRFMEGYGNMTIAQALEYWDALAVEFKKNETSQRLSSAS